MGIKIHFKNDQEARDFEQFRDELEDTYSRKEKKLKQIGSLLDATPVSVALGLGAYLATKKPHIFEKPFTAYAMGAFTSGAAATSYSGLLQNLFVKPKLENLKDEKENFIKSYLRSKKIPYEYTSGDYKYKVLDED
ncbi:MAG: hypothetical protein QXW35_05105 [Candidatus Aenigmatarchaeota archaeon]